MGRDDALDHGHAFVDFESRDRCDAALGLMQEIGGRAKGAAHRTVIERDEAHRADLGKRSFARCLGRQGSHSIRCLETIPIGLVRHALVRRSENRGAQLLMVEGQLRQTQQAAVRQALDRPHDSAQWLLRSQPLSEFEQGPLAFPENDAVERPEFEHQFRPERRLHTARHHDGPGS